MAIEHPEIHPDTVWHYFSFGGGQPYAPFHVKVGLPPDAPEIRHREIMARWHGAGWCAVYTAEDYAQYQRNYGLTRCLLEIYLPPHHDTPYYRAIGENHWR